MQQAEGCRWDTLLLRGYSEVNSFRQGKGLPVSLGLVLLTFAK